MLYMLQINCTHTSGTARMGQDHVADKQRNRQMHCESVCEPLLRPRGWPVNPLSFMQNFAVRNIGNSFVIDVDQAYPDNACSKLEGGFNIVIV